MKVRAVVLVFLAFSVGVLSFAASQAHADPMGDLCTILNTGRNNLAALDRQIANESNPLKKDALQQRVPSTGQQTADSLDNFFKVNRLQIVNYTGEVSSIDVMHYNTGPGVILKIVLPCKVTISVQFLEITNPAWGNLDPKTQTPLPPFRPALENLAVHDTVTFSGRLFIRHDTYFYFLQKLSSPGGLDFSAVLTELVEKGGIVSKAPDTAAFAAAQKPATAERAQQLEALFQQFLSNPPVALAGASLVGRDRYPMQVRIASYDRSSNNVTGEVEWPTLNAVHRIEGSLVGRTLIFREVAHIKKGKAGLGCVYELQIEDERSLAGMWKRCDGSSDSGRTELTWK